MSKEVVTICLLLLVVGLTLPTVGKITVVVGATCLIARAAVSLAMGSAARLAEA